VTHLSVATLIDAPAHAVWAELAAIERHGTWMADVNGIRFDGTKRSGVGTRFVADTRVGPIRLADRMEITEWVDGASMGVRHSGVVTGVGRFSIESYGPAATWVQWDEELKIPWWLGGGIGGLAAGRFVLTPLWRANLQRLKDIVETRR
jgi:hypothetical protein